MKLFKNALASLILCAILAAVPAPAQSTNPDFDAVASKLDTGGTFYLYADIENVLTGFVDDASAILESLDKPQAAMIPPIARAVMTSLGLDQLDDIGISIVPLDERHNRMKGFLRLQERTGLFGLCGDDPHPMESLAFVPSDAVYVSAQDFSFEKLLPLIDTTAADVMGAEGAARIAMALDSVKSRLGIDVPLLLDSLGGEMALYLRFDAANRVEIELDGPGIDLPRPSFAFLIKTKDSTLHDTLKAQLDRFAHVPVETATVGPGLTAHILVLEDHPLQLKPCFVQNGQWLMVASDLNELSAALQTEASGRGILADPELKTLAQGLPTAVNGFEYADARLGQIVGDIIEKVLSKAPLGAMEAVQINMMLQGNLSAASSERVAVRINHPDGIQWIAQGSVGPASALQAALIAPVAVMSAVAIPNFLEAQTRSKVSRTKTDQRTMATALESYYIDCNTYPAWAVGDLGVHADMPKDSLVYQVPTFRIAVGDERMFSMTTPIAYITSYPRDQFADVKSATHAYYSDPAGQGWIVYSPGPDGDYDLDPANEYDPYIAQPSLTLIVKAFDATNGTVSGGDVFRVKQ